MKLTIMVITLGTMLYAASLVLGKFSQLTFLSENLWQQNYCHHAIGSSSANIKNLRDAKDWLTQRGRHYNPLRYAQLLEAEEAMLTTSKELCGTQPHLMEIYVQHSPASDQLNLPNYNYRRRSK
jgi:hypothetical protein